MTEVRCGSDMGKRTHSHHDSVTGLHAERPLRVLEQAPKRTLSQVPEQARGMLGHLGQVGHPRHTLG